MFQLLFFFVLRVHFALSV